IGKLLEGHKFPEGVEKFQELVKKTEINIKSEEQYKQTSAKLEADFLEKKYVQEDEDLESLYENISESGDDYGDTYDEFQENGIGGRNSGQAGLEEYTMRSSFSGRQSQQLEALFSDPTAIQRQEGHANELENKKWSDSLKKLGSSPTVQDYLTSQGFKFTITVGDGDCFYNSIRHTTMEDQVLETRQVIHVGVGDFLSTLEEDDRALHTELQVRYQSGHIMQNARGSNDENAYGEMSECPAVARLYDRPVVVLNRTQASSDQIALDRRPIIFYPNGQPGDMTADMNIPKNAIVLVHSGGVHWDGAIPSK
ncbi:MAG: OTU domain-containing protein, partial [Spartobacteria bacterium]